MEAILKEADDDVPLVYPGMDPNSPTEAEPPYIPGQSQQRPSGKDAPLCRECNSFFADESYGGLCNSCFMRSTMPGNQPPSAREKPRSQFTEPQSRQQDGRFTDRQPRPQMFTEPQPSHQDSRYPPHNRTQPNQQSQQPRQYRDEWQEEDKRGGPAQRREERSVFSPTQNPPHRDPSARMPNMTAPIVGLSEQMGGMNISAQCFICTGGQLTGNSAHYTVCPKHAATMTQMLTVSKSDASSSEGEEVRSKPSLAGRGGEDPYGPGARRDPYNRPGDDPYGPGYQQPGRGGESGGGGAGEDAYARGQERRRSPDAQRRPPQQQGYNQDADMYGADPQRRPTQQGYDQDADMYGTNAPRRPPQQELPQQGYGRDEGTYNRAPEGRPSQQGFGRDEGMYEHGRNQPGYPPPQDPRPGSQAPHQEERFGNSKYGTPQQYYGNEQGYPDKQRQQDYPPRSPPHGPGGGAGGGAGGSAVGGAVGGAGGISAKDKEEFPRMKSLCAITGCSYKGYRELQDLCPDCYSEHYRVDQESEEYNRILMNYPLI